MLGCLSLLRHTLTAGHHDSERPGEMHRPSSQIHQKKDTFLPSESWKSNLVPPFHFPSPPLFERTDCCPLLSPGVVTLHRFKEFSIGASTHCIDFLLHSCIAANLMEKKKKISKMTHKCTVLRAQRCLYTHTEVFRLPAPCVTMQSIKMLRHSFVLVCKEGRSSSLSLHFEIFATASMWNKRLKYIYIYAYIHLHWPFKKKQHNIGCSFYLSNHGQVWLLGPGPTINIIALHRDQLSFTILTSQNIQNPINLYHTEIMSCLRNINKANNEKHNCHCEKMNTILFFRVSVFQSATYYAYLLFCFGGFLMVKS